MDPVQPELDRVFQASLDRFTATRDAVARELRSRGEREAAESVKRLRKPSVTAWAINQLAHGHPDRVSELLSAGARLRDAQQALLGGGDRDALREAAAEERRLVAELAEVVAGELEQAGHSAGPVLQTRIHETLHSAAGNEEVRDLLGAGRLQHDYQLGDLGLLAGSPPSAGSGTRASARKSDPSRKLATLQRRLERERTQQKELRGQVSEAEAAMRDAQRTLARAGAAAERAESGVSRSRRRLDAATTRVLELESELKRLRASG